MGKIIDDIQDGLEHLPPDMRDRLERQIAAMVSHALEDHRREDRHAGPDDHSGTGCLMDLYGALASDQPRGSGEEELAAAKRYVVENNRRGSTP